jgi:hypothetical protein
MDKLTEKIILNGKIRAQNMGEDVEKINQHWEDIDWTKKMKIKEPEE